MLNVLLVGLGGFIGSALRYLTVLGANRMVGGKWYSYGTLAVNVIGCLVFGFLAGIIHHKGVFGDQAKLFLLAGILGGFTTFSAFSFETFVMLRDGMMLGAFTNIVLSVVLGLAVAFCGYKLSGVI
ncbi:MAG: fluoride efflux transporter CrcB [Planctomycetota bacterium]|jgi:CrcB protein